MGHVLLAFSEHGLPEAIRTDNEAMFTSRPWLAMLGALGIVARRGPPFQPWHNGRIERLWGTLKQAIGRKG
ncbi:DDE-type integrase/transposase/recombinase [Ramlibacter sp. WS9]|uniref:DDE-type integrase/transposase/recombinase n=1 Tax=Ramlibacter sp. WS9 TaxID=1882741 RepID=UPI0011429F4A|nr:DDE-type integrase/transposase/recombinase [Ramlibacter sp. WS9]ROZ63174.1 transposase [Ramlibacter sp. WS9]